MTPLIAEKQKWFEEIQGDAKTQPQKKNKIAMKFYSGGDSLGGDRPSGVRGKGPIFCPGRESGDEVPQ